MALKLRSSVYERAGSTSVGAQRTASLASAAAASSSAEGMAGPATRRGAPPAGGA